MSEQENMEQPTAETATHESMEQSIGKTTTHEKNDTQILNSILLELREINNKQGLLVESIANLESVMKASSEKPAFRPFDRGDRGGPRPDRGGPPHRRRDFPLEDARVGTAEAGNTEEAVKTAIRIGRKHPALAPPAIEARVNRIIWLILSFPRRSMGARGKIKRSNYGKRQTKRV
ncbi:MAG: hypothetical protein R1F54_09855 [Candidatus Zeuxoniibacter abyssi]|nr:MAG: hypothetical protein R1F54_09855 [Candidatus Persebacteraceae bacterium AB1(2)]